MENKEYEIGETFKFGDVKLLVTESIDNGGCVGCYFYIENDCRAICSIGTCSRFTRKDNTNIIFIKSEE